MRASHALLSPWSPSSQPTSRLLVLWFLLSVSPSLVWFVHIFHFHHTRCAGPFSMVMVVMLVSWCPSTPRKDHVRVGSPLCGRRRSSALLHPKPEVNAILYIHTKTHPPLHRYGTRHRPASPRHIHICTVYHQTRPDTSIPRPLITRTIASCTHPPTSLHPPSVYAHALNLLLLY
ncbi:hypothetical protein K438DRAFT_1020828 [Mycena galopus ATCC 62051]|nr:hypothetical protein K438DRAFT_1020828 [Mycena galopus ATCC 62051]